MIEEYRQTRLIILRQLKLAQQNILTYSEKITSNITREHIERLQARATENIKKLNGQ